MAVAVPGLGLPAGGGMLATRLEAVVKIVATVITVAVPPQDVAVLKTATGLNTGSDHLQAAVALVRIETALLSRARSGSSMTTLCPVEPSGS